MRGPTKGACSKGRGRARTSTDSWQAPVGGGGQGPQRTAARRQCGNVFRRGVTNGACSNGRGRARTLHTSGRCRDQLSSACSALHKRGAGCTAPPQAAHPVDGGVARVTVQQAQWGGVASLCGVVLQSRVRWCWWCCRLVWGVVAGSCGLVLLARVRWCCRLVWAGVAGSDPAATTLPPRLLPPPLQPILSRIPYSLPSVLSLTRFFSAHPSAPLAPPPEALRPCTSGYPQCQHTGSIT
eukprot:353245-Chlamydomonas_euryale.AAC.2